MNKEETRFLVVWFRFEQEKGNDITEAYIADRLLKVFKISATQEDIKLIKEQI